MEKLGNIFGWAPKNSSSIESLIRVKGEKITLLSESMFTVNNYVACLGPPGSGKSSFCCAFYLTKYNTPNNFFEISNSNLSYTKGLWVLNEDSRRKIPINIERDIIDVEGFQADEIKCWKYVMIVSFLATDLLLLNRNQRYDDIKKVMRIIVNSFAKMEKLGIPRILKNIFIQIKRKKDCETFQLEKFLENIGCNLEDFKGVIIKPMFIYEIPDEELTENPQDNEKYCLSIQSIVNQLTPVGLVNSVSHIKTHIPNFNAAVNGDACFNEQTIMLELKDDYNNCYKRWETKSKNQLFSKKLGEVLSLNESYEDYLARHSIDFSFKENLDDLTFHGSSARLNELYSQFKEEKSFKIDSNIFQDNYRTEYEMLKNKNDQVKQEILTVYNKKIAEMSNYLSTIKFKGFINTYYDCSIYVNNEALAYDFKQENEKRLAEQYKQKRDQKEKDWEDQIQRAKWKSTVQASGNMQCTNGHNLNNNPVRCHKTNCGSLYWVDGDAQYVICNGCHEIIYVSGDLVCSRCNAPSYCKIKFITGYKP